MEEEAKHFNVPQGEVEKQTLLSKENASRRDMENSISPEVKQKRVEEQERKMMGLVAQEVEKVVPEVVKTHENGFLGVSYDQLIGLLIEGIKEQQIQIEEQQKEIEDLKLKVHGEISIKKNILFPETENDNLAEDVVNSKVAVLYQNTPNPFNQSTQIRYCLPESVTTAHLCFYDLYGKQLKQITISERGEGEVLIQGSEFNPGIYLYALISDEKEVDVKRMILTK